MVLGKGQIRFGGYLSVKGATPGASKEGDVGGDVTKAGQIYEQEVIGLLSRA